MITFSKQENGVLFTFENSDKYLYGDGTILVPFNSLAVIQDESDMITLRKSASWDIFLSGRFDTDFDFRTKQDAVDALKEALFDETGGGVTEEEVEQMIEEATSGIPSSQVIEQLRTDVNAVSGEVASKADESSLTAVNDALTAHTANTNIHVTSTEKSNWDAKQDALTAGANITISGNVISAEAGNNIIELTQAEYDALTEKDPDALYIITDAQEINMNDYATKTEVDNALSGKADTSALTAVSGDVTELSGDIDALQGDISILSGDIDNLTINKANESVVVALQGDVTALSGEVQTKLETSDFNAYSAATDARIAEDEEVTAAALNDLAETVSGKQDTLISGENIKTINNISILGEGNITVGGGGGGDYQYYSEDTTNESATIEVGEQSLTVDGNGVYVNNSPVVTAEELDDNYYGQQVIDEKEEVIASALTELNLRVTEDEEVTAAALNDLAETVSGKQDTLVYYSESTEDGTAGILITNGEGSTEEHHFSIGGGVAEIGIYNKYDDGQGNVTSNNASIYADQIMVTLQAGVTENGDTTSTELMVDATGVTINGENVATESYVDDAVSGKVDTSAITTAITSGSTDSEIPTAKATYDAIQAGGGGGAAYSAGTNISIANDTINCTLPITANTNNLQGYLLFGSNISVWGSESNGRYQIAIGKQISNPAYTQGQVAICPADTSSASNSVLSGEYPIGIGHQIISRGNGAVAIGDYANANGDNYVAIGTAKATGTTKMNLNDQIKVDTNNQVYIKDKTNTTDVCIQDAIAALGGLKFVKLTQAQYDALATKDSSTLYIISD